MLSWAFPVVTTVWGLQPVVWVVTVSGALSWPPEAQEQGLGKSPCSWGKQWGQIWFDLSVVLAVSTLCPC